MALIRNIGVRHSRAAARLVLSTAVIGVALQLAPSVSEAAVARPVATQATFTVTVSTPGGDVGPFATTQPVAAAVDANGGMQIDNTLVAFAPLQLVVDDALFTVELVPTSDLLANLTPATGAGAFGGEFAMLWHEADPSDGTCTAGPFGVQATTAPFGASPYSPSSGAVTLVDAAPSIPAASGCAHSDSVNAALSLPLSPAPDPPPNTIANPAITVEASFSPSIQLPAPPPTTTTPPPTATTPPTSATAVPGPASNAPQMLPAVTGSADAVHRRTVARIAPPRNAKATTTTSTTVDTSLNGVRDVVPFPDVGTARPASPNGPRARNPAIDPLPAAAHGPSTAVLLFGAALVIAAVSFALGLIGRDVRRLVPRRARRRRLGGPISPAPLPPGTQPPHELPWRS